MYKLGNNLLTLNGAVIFIPPAVVLPFQEYMGFSIKPSQATDEINNEYVDFYIGVDDADKQI